jgi:hypothetical protein
MGYEDGLGRRARMLAVGDPLTREQTNEVMMRTNNWRFTSCNDDEWEGITASILGWYDRFDELVKAGECEDDWYEWRKRSSQISEEYGSTVGALDLGHLDNDAIMSHSDEPGGWLRWDGTIRPDWYVGVKYPEVDEIEAEWKQIAAAFPFLEMRVQALSGGFGCTGAAPENTVIAEWIITHGTVTRMYIHLGFPPKPMFPKRKEDRWMPRLRHWLWGSKAFGPVQRVYYACRRARACVRHEWNWAFFPRMFQYGMSTFDERHVSAARLIEAADQMRTGDLTPAVEVDPEYSD